MSETKYEVYNVLDNPPKDGEVVVTDDGVRTFNQYHKCWDDIDGDDYENDLCSSYYYSYDIRAGHECGDAHFNFVKKYPNLSGKQDWDDWDGVSPYDYKGEKKENKE